MRSYAYDVSEKSLRHQLLENDYRIYGDERPFSEGRKYKW
jgi:hypothetical protein